MKGLLLKDFCLLKGQKSFWVGIVIISIVFLGIFENPAFVICYITLMAAMFTSSTLNYDEFQNGMSYLLTLPVSRRGYVEEKYVFGLSISACATILGVVFTLAAGIVKGEQYEKGELISAAVAGMMIAMVLMAVMIPLQLKFGAEKGRWALFGVYGMTLVVGYLAIKVFHIPFITIMNKLDWILEDDFAMTALCMVMGLVMLSISYFISIEILKKKQY
jgi:hypothetical protein